MRHEAGEAIGAIGKPEYLPLLTDLANNDPVPEVRDTCQLAVDRIKYYQSQKAKEEKLSKNPYNSVDPAPPLPEMSVDKLEEILLDSKRGLFERYRAMFSLRNIGNEESIKALGKGSYLVKY